MSDELLQPGDWVQADSDEIGVVVHTTRLSAFVKIVGDPPDATIRAFLLSQLIKIDPPSGLDPPPQ